MKYGWVNKNIVDIWSRSKYNSERVNQAFFCDIVRISSERSGYMKIRKSDGYTGWIDKRFITGCTKKQADFYLNKVNSVVVAKTTKLYQTDITEYPSMILYGTKLYKEKEQKKYNLFRTPSGDKFCLTKMSAKPIKVKTNNLGRKFVLEAKRFLDVPYLWGGISPLGFDCSGLVQSILGRFGIDIPRDTKDQIKAGRKIDFGSITTGDLLFFNRHVGFAIGKKRVIHSSIGGNGVRINSLDPNDEDYRQDLAENIKEARRIV